MRLPPLDNLMLTVDAFCCVAIADSAAPPPAMFMAASSTSYPAGEGLLSGPFFTSIRHSSSSPKWDQLFSLRVPRLSAATCAHFVVFDRRSDGSSVPLCSFTFGLGRSVLYSAATASALKQPSVRRLSQSLPASASASASATASASASASAPASRPSVPLSSPSPPLAPAVMAATASPLRSRRKSSQRRRSRLSVKHSATRSPRRRSTRRSTSPRPAHVAEGRAGADGDGGARAAPSPSLLLSDNPDTVQTGLAALREGRLDDVAAAVGSAYVSSLPLTTVSLSMSPFISGKPSPHRWHRAIAKKQQQCRLNIAWRFDADDDPDAMRGAEVSRVLLRRVCA